MRLPLVISACLLCSCTTPQPPHPIAPIARVDLKPVKDRVGKVEESSTKVGQKLEDTRAKLDASIVEAHNAKIDAAKLDENLQAASKSLNEAIAERKVLADQIQFLKVDVDQAQEKEDAANLAANAAVGRANTAEGKVYQYELQEKEDHGPWWAPGLNGIWRNFKFLGWHVIILLVILAAASFALNLLVPAARPILHVMAAFFAGLGHTLWGLISRLWRKTPPP